MSRKRSETLRQAQGRLWGTPHFRRTRRNPQCRYQRRLFVGKCAFSRFGKMLSSPLEGRFGGQLADSRGEIKLANLALLPYAG